MLFEETFFDHETVLPAKMCYATLENYFQSSF